MNDGGPAFPSACTNNSEDVRFGMSLRDYFAAKATNEDIDEFRDDFNQITRRKEWSIRARYAFADAMILEREKKK